MGDLFHEDVPEKFIYDVWDVMVKCSQHTFLLLTKRPERMKTFVSKVMANRKEYAETLKDKETRLKVINWAEKPVKNIWLGVTAENQEMADKRIPILLQIPAVVRFVSCEPLLGPVDLELYLPYDHSKYKEEWHRNGYHVLRLDKGITEGTLDWVVCGGESGPGARPMHPDWVRSLRNQCQVAGVPFLFKQQGEWSWDNTGSDIVGFIAPDGTWKPSQPLGWGADYPGSVSIWKVGKKKAGRLLDGRTWEEYPEV
jgi:protein gp37